MAEQALGLGLLGGEGRARLVGCMHAGVGEHQAQHQRGDGTGS